MIKKPPKFVGNGKVLLFLIFSENIKKTGNTRHYYVYSNESKKQIPNPSRLAICQYDNDSGFYLFYCDDNWNVLADTYHNSIEDAINQAEFEYINSKENWIKY